MHAFDSETLKIIYARVIHPFTPGTEQASLLIFPHLNVDSRCDVILETLVHAKYFVFTSSQTSDMAVPF